MFEERAVLQHCEFRVGRRARRRAEDRDVLAFPGIDRRIEAVRIDLASAFRESRPAQEARIVIFPHAAFIVVDDPLERRQIIRDLQELVRLFLVFGEDEFDLAIVEEITDFLAEAVLVDAERHGADTLSREFGPDPVRPIASDDADDIAPAHTKRYQTECQFLNMRIGFRPAVAFPDAKILLARRHLVGPAFGVHPQEFRQGILGIEIR